VRKIEENDISQMGGNKIWFHLINLRVKQSTDYKKEKKERKSGFHARV
jgi:hypothetical protein